MRLTLLAAAGTIMVGGSLIGCGVSDPDPVSDDDGSLGSGAGASTGNASTGSSSTANSDNDACGLTDEQEIAMGTDPLVLDSDADGFDDCAEVACVSNPADPAETCYACGWKHNDPGNLASNGSGVGSTVANVSAIDQCGETLELWDLAGDYHILWRTDAW